MKFNRLASLLCFGLSAAAPSFAQASITQDLTADHTALRPVAGTVANVSMLCPDGVMCFTNGTVIRLRFELGCVSQMTPVTYTTAVVDGRLNVYVSAWEILDRRARVALCLGPTIVEQTLTLVNQYGDVNVQFLTQTATE